MKFWFDLCHPPHVLFFSPQIKILQDLGHDTIITVRDRYQVADLCDSRKLKYYKIGRDYGKSKLLKARGVLARTLQLYLFCKNSKIDLAISQGSSYQVLAARMLKVPTLFMTDYEHIYWGIARKFASKIFVPQVIPDSILLKKGVTGDQIVKYPGLKEDVYLSDFKPNKYFLNHLGIQSNKIIVTIRPPLFEAHYHSPLSEKLYYEVISHFANRTDVTTIILPRSEKGRYDLVQRLKNAEGTIFIPKETLNGLDVIYYSDLVISGGGTMNREAAALGVPVYTIFKGPIAAMDKFLEKQGRLHFIDQIEDIQKIKIQNRNPGIHLFSKNLDLKNILVKQIIKMAEQLD